MYPNNWQQVGNNNPQHGYTVNAPNRPPNNNHQNYNNFQPQQYPPHQQFLQPQSGQPADFSRQNRAMYSSTIQYTTPQHISKPSGNMFGKLQSMGRFIKDEPDLAPRPQETPVISHTNNSNFLNARPQKDKMFSSVIYPKASDEQLNRFPNFNLADQKQSGQLSFNQYQSQKTLQFGTYKRPEQSNPGEAPQEKRKRQILKIKQQLQELNKKMGQTSFQKSSSSSGQDGKNTYMQLPTRKKASNIQNSMNTELELKNSFQNYAGDKQHIPGNSQPRQIPQNIPNQKLQYNIAGQANRNTQQGYKQAQGVTAQSLYKGSPVYEQGYVTNTVSTSSTASSMSHYQPLKNGQSSGQGGMFKKKKENPYTMSSANNQSDYTPKTFLLSPKNQQQLNQPLTMFKANNSQEAMPLPIIQTQTTSSQIKRTMSINDERAGNTPVKSFKKSDFHIGKKMGKGQFGEVMLVQHKQTGFLCGLKVMSKKQIRQQKYANQIARQLSIQFYLQHRNIAPLFGYFEDQENVYLLVEFCTGGQLLEMLRKNHRMEESSVSVIIKQICEGIDFIHKELIIHRDIKPENILFNFDCVKISDFGWAVYRGHGMRRTVSGSPLYYSPEVVLETQYDEKIDIWAIGMMTYECLLGKIPFRIYSELDLNRIVEDEIKFPQYVDVSDQAKSFILNIMKKKPEQRMQIKEMLRHPFITKHNAAKLAPEILDEFRRVLSQ